MKTLNIVAAIVLEPASGFALAERGSGEDNQIAYPESTSLQRSSADGHSSLTELTVKNR
ncbi:hypothetical protein [Vreelandella andesensis]|uniref:hypothetical protein n=1 Tax=Vreelandella andesensis TaxID=447567 RepID=UPI00142D5CFA|nr:hypothetical protein [Halomonas andesensis]